MKIKYFVLSLFLLLSGCFYDYEPLSNPRLAEGTWEGYWDDIWYVRFTINHIEKNEYEVVYEWEEKKEEKLSKITGSMFSFSPNYLSWSNIDTNYLNRGSRNIEIVFLNANLDKAVAIGKFKTTRIAQLKKILGNEHDNRLNMEKM